jgi:hypothetical protein
MEKWKPLRASHFSTPPTAAELLTRPLRYTNNLAGTKDRAEHSQAALFFSVRKSRAMTGRIAA